MQIFFHLTELSTRCLVKEKRMTEQLLTTPSFRVCHSITFTPYPKIPFFSQETIHSTKKSEKSSILFNKYEKLFSFVDMLDEQRNSSRSLRGNRSGSTRGTKREATPIEVPSIIYLPNNLNFARMTRKRRRNQCTSWIQIQNDVSIR